MITDTNIVDGILQKFDVNKQLTPITKSSTESNYDILKDYNTDFISEKTDQIKDQVYYNYEGDQYFDHEITNYKSMKINLIFYSIHVHNYIPFVLFLMYKYPKDSEEFGELFSFPHFMSTKSIEDEVREKEEKIFKHYGRKGNYKYLRHQNEIYVLCEQECEGYDLNLSRTNKWWWCLPFELINLKKVLSFNVDDKIVNFLTTYDKLMYVYNEKKQEYESPIVAYDVVTEDNFNFSMELGKLDKYKDYVYYTYKGSLDKIKPETGNEKIMNLIRKIVFLHKMKNILTKDYLGVKHLWKKYYSLIVNDVDKRDCLIIVRNDSQISELSYHKIKLDLLEFDENII